MAQQPHFSIQTVTQPASEPVDVITAAEWLRVDGDDDMPRVADLISAAREIVERDTGRALMPQTLRQSMDRFPLIPNSQYSPGNPNAITPVLQNTWPLDQSAWAILLARSPLISVTTLQYYDTSGAIQTMDPATYLIDSDSAPPRLSPASGGFWPGVSSRPNAVQITFQAGYASAAAVPASLRLAVKLLVANFYDNPNAIGAKLEELPLAYQSLISAYSVIALW